MDLNSVLREELIDPDTTLVLRHRPREPELRRVLPWLAVEQPEVFNDYQQTQTPRVERQMQRASHIVSFIGHQAGRALFVGLYENRGHKKTKRPDRNRNPAHRELSKYGHVDSGREVLWFDLVLTKHFSKWAGKLIIRWPPPEISWSRWSGKNAFEILAILDESLLTPGMPDWRELIFTWNELQVIPRKWRAALAEWRGVYFILDVSDGRGYVGSAYGRDNILGRWRDYTKSGHGGNKRLRSRRPENLRFTILERVSPDTPADQVIDRERTWKQRLHTRDHGLNEN